jgi:hypothetical protein
MMRWLVLAGLIWGFWGRDGADSNRGAWWSAPGSLQTMDGGDPFPPHLVDPTGGVKTMDGGDPFPPK